MDELKESILHSIANEEVSDTSVKLILKDKHMYLVAYLKKGSNSIVNRVEYVSKGKLIRKDYFAPKKLITEYYLPKEGKATLYQRRFFNSDGSVAYDEFIQADNSIFIFSDDICYSKEELMQKLMKKLELKSTDIVLLDRATGIGQAVFKTVKPAKLGVVIHAEHYNESLTTSDSILWNNFYEYQFTNADKVDFFLASTDEQKIKLASQFEQYTSNRPKIYAIPVGSVDINKHPAMERKKYSMITASRLAVEKHIDYLVKAVVIAKKTLPELTFDIYGTGGEEAKLRSIITEENASSYIALKGHQDMHDIYKNYQVYLTASKSEGFGLTLLEAAASGLPIIGFDVPYGNITFVKDQENGYLIPTTEMMSETEIVQSFVDKIVKIFENNDLSMYFEKSYQIASEYDDYHVKMKWEHLLKEESHA